MQSHLQVYTNIYTDVAMTMLLKFVKTYITSIRCCYVKQFHKKQRDDNVLHKKQAASNSLSKKEKFERNLERLKVFVTDKKVQALHLAPVNLQLNDMIKQAEAVAEVDNSNIKLQSLSESITPQSEFK